ncbi:COG3772 Phage-related lysozyme (muraminidase) [uncultured Caudovirales phage]|uniref:Endolysin n=1 Tax=uncultured Caudovirales phage TaxID=2100421 RepID=A0A6J5MS33_9CAUD|nr:COG3772 Phage-related lysozyme (muraminidase) [uncultured Caudovirales phage]
MNDRARQVAAALTISSAAIAGIAFFEGYRAMAYRDVGGIPTIGYGETKGVKMGDTTTPERALVRLQESANEHVKGMVKCIKVPITQGELDAYASFTYNVGVGAFCSSTLNKKLNSSDYAGACKELLKWTMAGGKVFPGLIKRRQEEYVRCIGG